MVDEVDWEFLKVCIRSGMVTVQKNTNLISQSIVHHRLDVLCEIVLYVADLSEFQALSLFYYLFNFPLQQLVSISMF